MSNWNRLEGRPRTDSFDRALRAEIRDPLWMLCRQWQTGEFIGDDAGSPVRARVHVRSAPIQYFQGRPFRKEIPLEAQVEQRPLDLEEEEGRLFRPTLDIRLALGRRLGKLLSKSAEALKREYKIEKPDEADSYGETEAYFQTVADKFPDGWKVYMDLKKGKKISGIDTKTAEEFIPWVERLFLQGEEDAWNPSRLEYQFSCTTVDPLNENRDLQLEAKEYYHGRLDWYNFDLGVPEKKGSARLETSTEKDEYKVESLTREFIPTPVRFKGMPNTRWWTFEDQQTSFGGLRPDTTDLAKLLLMEFGLVYGNDWFLTPLRLKVGAISKIAGFTVTNTFDERFWISPANTTDPPGTESYDWKGWNLFGLKNTAENEIESCLLLLPTVPKIQESAPLEKVAFLRDEMANLVWGVESVITLPDGSTKPGLEAARERMKAKDNGQSQVGVSSNGKASDKASIKYQIMTTVPENWIPFIPVHMPGSTRSIRLQRAAMPRPETFARISPKTRLLKEPPAPYYIYEEEIPRAGIHVTQTYQRTRWLSGRTVVWLGVRKHTGRGEGSSGLAFDRAVDKKVKTDA